jgi:hypothetical protein
MQEEQENAVQPDTRVWAYGPGGQAQIFDHPEQIPEGWEDHPSKVEAGLGNISDTTADPNKGNSTASDHTGGGNDSINRGQPHGEPTGSTTQGGETGQPTDSTFVLKPIDDVDKNWIMQHLNTRKVPHNPRWAKQKLYDLLRDNATPNSVTAAR